MPEATDSPPSEIVFIGAVLTLLIVVAALLLIVFGFADPYPLGGMQSARWWWLRYPMVFAAVMLCVTLQTIIASRIDDVDFAKEFDRATDGMNAILFAAGLVVVTFGGGTLMNLYNASYGEGRLEQ